MRCAQPFTPPASDGGGGSSGSDQGSTRPLPPQWQHRNPQHRRNPPPGQPSGQPPATEHSPPQRRQPSQQRQPGQPQRPDERPPDERGQGQQPRQRPRPAGPRRPEPAGPPPPGTPGAAPGASPGASPGAPGGPGAPPAGPPGRPAGRPDPTAPAPTRSTRPNTPQQWQHPGYTPKQRIVEEVEPEPEKVGLLRILAAIGLSIAALGALTYAGWAVTARRGIFADLADSASLSPSAGKDNDRLDTILLWTAVILLVLAVVLWLLVHLLRKKPFGTSGFTAIALLGVGSVVALVGAYVTSMTGTDVDEAGTAATGYLIIGGGFLLLAGGVIAALLAVFAKPPAVETPTAGFAGWQHP
ncbi:MAG: hypothetical protein GEU96_05595 [Propionibacteriales bacterium]|nr:hypothetical protein [Propionibacteriales bacterium]